MGPTKLPSICGFFSVLYILIFTTLYAYPDVALFQLEPWWRHKTETFSALLAIWVGNSPVTGEFPAQRPATRTLMFSLICARIKGWVNNGGAGDLRRHCAHYDVTVMTYVTVEKSFYFLLTTTIFDGGIVGAFHTDKQGIWPFEPYVHDKRQNLMHLLIASATLLSGYCFVSGILLAVADAKQIS